MIRDQLIQLEECLNKVNAPVIKYLRTGIERNVLEEVIKESTSVNKISEDIIQLYNWHGGTNVRNDMPAENFYIFPTYYLNSIDEIRLLYEQNNFQIIENKMLPIFSSGRGESLVVDLNKGNDSKVFCIEPWNPEADTYTAIYDNLMTMLETVITCYKRNMFYVTKEGLLEMDFDKAWEISEKMNPDSKYWKDV